LEFGSPKKPMTAEALALHYIDNLDAKLMGYMELFRSAKPGPEDSRFGSHAYMLDVRPYFPRNLDYQRPPGFTTPSSSPSRSSEGRDGTGPAKVTPGDGDLPF